MTAATNARRDAGVTACRLDEDGLTGLDFAGLFGGIDHCKTDAVFYAGSGILAFELGDDGSGQTCCHTIQTHERGMTNQFSYVRGNTRHDLLLFRDEFPDTSWKMRGIAVELSGGKDTRAHGRTPGIGALTRTVLATSTHVDSVFPEGMEWQDGA